MDKKQPMKPADPRSARKGALDRARKIAMQNIAGRVQGGAKKMEHGDDDERSEHC